MQRTKAKGKKVLTILIMLVLIMSISVVIRATSHINNPTFITFEDENLFNAIKSCLSANKIDYNVTNIETKTIEVSIDDVNSITELDLSGNEDTKITSISGLENFVNLRNLNLSGNSVQSMESIIGENSLSLIKLNITGNTINEELKTAIRSFSNLVELNMTNTGISDVSFLTQLSNLETLILSNNHISNFEPLNVLPNLIKLDISKNESFTEFAQIKSHYGLKELNVSGTGISSFDGIQQLGNLEKLYASDNARITETTSISPIYSTYEAEVIVDGETKEVDVPYLDKIKILNLSNIGVDGNRPIINFKYFARLTTLEETHFASNEISKLTDIAELENLVYLDLANNEIESDDLDELIQYDEDEDGNKFIMTENTLQATKIDMRGNEIINVGVFAVYPADIKYLDLSNNHIFDITPLSKHSFSEALYLQKQDITFGIYEKKVEVDQYIILPTIIQYSQIPGSLVYSDDCELIFNGVTLNPEYTDPLEYNVIIDSAKTKDDLLSVRINGGTASGTVLNFKIGSKSGAHINCLIESIIFVDENLDRAIDRDLLTKYNKKINYWKRVPHILNINQTLISAVKDFDLKNTDTTDATKIKDLIGIENFYNLETLYLQDNNLINIKPLEGCTKLQTLNLANNPGIGDNNSSIEKLFKLYELDMSNTGMTNINSLNNMINTVYVNKKKTPIMTILNLSNNGLESVNGLENITSLQYLYIANENLDDEDIEILKPLTNLVTLNISGNKIENIDVISNFAGLQYLYFNKNKVKSLEPIDGMIFAELEFSDNRIKDISPLSEHHTINNLNMNNNQIEDVSILSNILITEEQTLSVTGQKIMKIYEKGATGEISIELPQIFKAARQSGNKIYTTYDLILTNCTLDSSGNNVIINIEELGEKTAQVSIYGGKASGTTLLVAAPLEGKITYNPSNEAPMNKDITATVSFNRSNVTITNNDGKPTYTFTENGEFTFEFVDKDGFEGTATAVVENIDKVLPQGIVTKTIKDGKVIITIQVSEEIAEISGWEKTINNDGKIILTKVYENNSTENVKLIDLAGNEFNVKVEVIIDKTNPKITGVSNGEKYNISVTPNVEDQSEVRIVLKKDGSVVSNYKIGTPITDAGLYVLTVTDAFGNTTIVSFEIEILDIIISKDITKVIVEESENLATIINPKTTVLSLKSLFKAQMDYTIIDKNGNIALESANVGTGYQIRMTSNKLYTLIVRGDCNGDGNATITDIFSINSHRLNVKTLSGLYQEAADVNDDGKADIKDIFKINSYRLQGGQL